MLGDAEFGEWDKKIMTAKTEMNAIKAKEFNSEVQERVIDLMTSNVHTP